MKKHLLLILGLFVVVACHKKADEPSPETFFVAPSHFPKPVYPIDSNVITAVGFDLGKNLFYDGILSKDSTIACGECHRQTYVFTHHMHDLSHGIYGRVGLRNAQSLQNLAWRERFQWDGKAATLNEQPILPIEHPDEMDDDIDNVVARVGRHKGYQDKFKAAFGSEGVTKDRLLKALTQFMLSLVSYQSRYDKYVLKDASASFTQDELDGMSLFNSKGCSNCHKGVLFTDESFRNNGLSKFERTKIEYVNEKPVLQIVVDEGRFRVTGNANDKFKFKVPSLRNVAASSPYMHDGRYTSLLEVLNFYDASVQDYGTLDPVLRQSNGRLGIQMTAEEKRKIIAFLNTLTDDTFLKDKRFAEPDGFPVR
ncbi:cytochrome-c peroxidase [Flectobacillus roseus]